MLLHFLHGPLLKLVALSNLLGVHGLFRSLVVAFLAVAVRSNSGLRTAIIRMLVFHRSTSALPVHWWPLRDAHFTPACSAKTTYFRPEDEPLRWEARRERMWHSGRVAEHQHVCRNRLGRISSACLISQSLRVVLVVRKGHETVEKLFFTPHVRQNVLVSY